MGGKSGYLSVYFTPTIIKFAIQVNLTIPQSINQSINQSIIGKVGKSGYLKELFHIQ
jgi:hypothetical protein